MISVNATLFVQIINLLVLIWIMNRVMYRPLRRLVGERQEKVKGGLAEAARTRDQASQGEQDYLRQRNEGRQQIREELDKLKEQTQQKANELVAASHEKARADYNEFVQTVDRELAEARKEIRAEAEAVAMGMASTVLGRGLS